MAIDLRAPLAGDGEALSAMARQSFLETFGSLYRPADVAAFVDEKFGRSGLAAQIGDPRYRIRIATDGERIAGFAKLGPVVLPPPAPREHAIELHQLYVLREWQGAGVAHALMDWALGAARAAGHRAVCLGVYADNPRAQRFYARYGFSEIGRYGFPVGEHIDDERIWLLELAA